MSEIKKHILLIYPPSRTQTHANCPMGMMMIAAVLENSGYKVSLLDANAQRKKLDTEQIIQISKELKPDVIGVTLLTPMIKEAYKLASGLKNNGVKLIAGGPHPTILPEEAISNSFDAVVVGEGEPTIVEAVKALLNFIPMEGVRGLVYRNAEGVTVYNDPRQPIENLDDLPLPARHLVNPLDYGPLENDALHTSLFSSRGCSAKCTYCSGQVFGKRFRFRSAQNVLDEITHLNTFYGTTHFHFVDDAMAMDKKRVIEICDGLLQNNLNITWSMMTRIDSVTEELLAIIARAGCTQIEYGVESGHPETLKKIHKPHTVDMVRRVIPLTAKYGIKPFVFFILGFPWEGPQEIESTQNLMVELSPYVDNFHPAIASILIPFPGTKIYETYKDQYALENWWLSADRCYDAPNSKTHSYCETVMFRNGAVLDADFFHYSPNVKRKIFQIFKFMYMHNINGHNNLAYFIKFVLFTISEKLSAWLPSLESKLFSPIMKTKMDSNEY